MKSEQELKTLLENAKIPVYRAKQVLHAIYKEGIDDYCKISTIPRSVIKVLQANAPIYSLVFSKNAKSRDNKTEKVLFKTKDNCNIEAVLMRFKDGRNTVCVSCQIGCQLGCKFCATGKMGFTRNLDYEEIADQVLYFAQKLKKEHRHISNVVYMGMGEPFMNYENVIMSARLINSESALNIGARNLTISTSGICEGIDKLAKEKLQINLAVSLHAPSQTLRERIMPIAKKYDLDQLMDSIDNYIEKTKRRVTYEYIMLKGINDSSDHARLLSHLLKHQLCHVNLIPYNATDIENMHGSDRETIDTFKNILTRVGIPVTVRVSLGQDIAAACGQLANKQ